MTETCWKNNNDAWLWRDNVLNDRLFGISGRIEVGGRIDGEFRTMDDFRKTGESQIKCSDSVSDQIPPSSLDTLTCTRSSNFLSSRRWT